MNVCSSCRSAKHFVSMSLFILSLWNSCVSSVKTDEPKARENKSKAKVYNGLHQNDPCTLTPEK